MGLEDGSDAKSGVDVRNGVGAKNGVGVRAVRGVAKDGVRVSGMRAGCQRFCRPAEREQTKFNYLPIARVFQSTRFASCPRISSATSLAPQVVVVAGSKEQCRVRSRSGAKVQHLRVFEARFSVS